MIKESLFNDNILMSIYQHFRFFFTQNNLIVYVITVLMWLLLNWLIVCFLFKSEKTTIVPRDKYLFKDASASKWWCLGVLLLSVSCYVAVALFQENSIFVSYDLMSDNAIKNMYVGNVPIFYQIRFAPLTNIDHNLIYAVSRNFTVINCWIVLKQLVCLYLLYKFFIFIPIDKRLLLITVINFLPAVFVVNNIIYAEQLILIFVLLSFINLNNYCTTSKKSYLLLFTIFLNLAIYSKETVVLLYGGLLCTFVLRRIINDEINLLSFLHPFKTLSRMPIEYMMFWSLFIFSSGYMLCIDDNTGEAYILSHQLSMLLVADINKFIIALNVIALLLAGYKIIRRQFNAVYLLNEGTLLGVTFITFVIVCKLKLVVLPDYYKTYYLYLPAIFSTAYIFYSVRSKIILKVLLILILFYSGYVNFATWQREEGTARREIAEYILSKAKKEPINIFMKLKGTYSSVWWKIDCWSSALKYHYPQGSIVLKVDIPFDLQDKGNEFYYEIRTGKPQSGDYFVLHKNDYPDFVPQSSYLPVYENKVYKIFHIIGE